jgi:hypothetical protein
METPTTRNLVTGDNTLLAAVAEATMRSKIARLNFFWTQPLPLLSAGRNG